jgi:hypothetical protein
VCLWVAVAWLSPVAISSLNNQCVFKEFAMQIAKIVGVSALAMVIGALPAMAQPEHGEGPAPFLMVSPAKVIAGQTVTPGGTCHDTSRPLVTSPGFAAPIALGAHGKAVDKVGRYTATLKCKDRVLTTSFEVIKSARLDVQPKQVQPGGKVDVKVWCAPASSVTHVTSPGFVKDVTIGYLEGSPEGGFGDGKAVAKPGTYTATVDCAGGKVTTTFTVVKPGVPQPGQVTVKPKGAPQTGGGFLAG